MVLVYNPRIIVGCALRNTGCSWLTASLRLLISSSNVIEAAN